MTSSRHFHIKFLQGSYSAEDALYGSANYGDSTYGAVASQSALGGVKYELLPAPGWHPQEPAWTFRYGDSTRFEAFVVDAATPTTKLDVSPITAAHLVLTQWTFDGSKAWKRGFPLLLNETDNSFYRDWDTFDLIVAGRFRVAIRMLFDSGRYMTVETNDSVVLQVNDSSLRTSLLVDDLLTDTHSVVLTTPQGEPIAIPEGQTV